MPQTLLPPQSRGWNTRDPIVGMEAGFAPILDNYVIEGGAPRVRRGWRSWATGLGARVDGLLPWNGAGASPRLFASAGTSIFDVTTAGAVGAAVVTGLTNARWSSINVAASGGNFLFAFNGADTSRTFDGTTWANWTGTGVTGGVAWAGTSQGRLYVGNPGRLSFFYGGAGAIGGAFTEFPLQGVAQLGGGVAAVTTISGDGGQGPQTLTVFITTEGEIIVYSGNDPSSVSTWSLVGRWRVPRPVGAPHRCVTQWGGDALLMTEGGTLPLSSLRAGDESARAMERFGVTRRILPTWQAIIQDRRGLSGWGITPLTRLGLLVINAPWTGTAAQQIVVSEGEALTRWFGVNAAVWAEALNGRAFFGDATSTGRVLLYGEDASDGGFGIRSEGLTTFTVLGRGSTVKRTQLVQPILRGAVATEQTLRVLSDWNVPVAQLEQAGPTLAPSSLPVLPGGSPFLVFDSAVPGEAWDVGLWAGDLSSGVTRNWRAAPSIGHAHAVLLRMTTGYSRPQWLGTNLVFEGGGPVR